MIDPYYKNEVPAERQAGIEKLRKMVENNEYMNEGIQRIALVLSDEILNYKNYKEGGQYSERFRKRRK